MRLALRLGRTLGELGESMSSEEFNLWLTLYEEEPWDESRADFRAGIISATIANWAGMVRRENAPEAVPADYMPFMGLLGEPEQAPEQDREPDPLEHFSQFT